MEASFRIRRCFDACVLFGALVPVASAQGAPVAVAAAAEIELLDGQRLFGQVDARTDAHALWLRLEDDAIVLSAPFRWSDLKRLALDGRDVADKVWKSACAEVASEAATGFLASNSPTQMTSLRAGGVAAVHNALVGASSSRVISVDLIAAAPVNLDRDSAADGLRAVLAVHDSHGRLLPVEGQMTAELVGQRLDWRNPRPQWEVLGRWSQRLTPSDFRDGMAVVDLRFRRVWPEWETDLHPGAQLRIRVGVHGEGNYEASSSVALRPCDPVRDRRQLSDGQRHGNHERFSRPIGGSDQLQGGLWPAWQP